MTETSKSNEKYKLSDKGYTPAHIANYFISVADVNKQTISILKLMKLVYFAYAWNLSINRTKLFAEKIEA